MSRSSRPSSQQPDVAAIAVALVALALVLALSGCHTYEAVVSAPPDFWIHVETIILAVLDDLASLVRLFV